MSLIVNSDAPATSLIRERAETQVFPGLERIADRLAYAMEAYFASLGAEMMIRRGRSEMGCRRPAG